MQALKRFARLKSIIIFIFFCLAFFIPRYFAHLQYEPLEDEFLSIMFSLDFSLKNLMFPSDNTHPGLWYAVMKLPTTLFVYHERSMFYFRLIQILFLLSCLLISYFCFRKKLANNFFLIIFSLLLSNLYLVHITFQNRMFALLLGIAFIYSMIWYEIIKNKKNLTLRRISLLAIIALLGFFTDYSMIWLIPFWPITYLFINHDLVNFKKVALFFSLLLIGVSWFIPIFLSNIEKSFTDNSWIPDFNFKNAIELLGNIFGLIPRYSYLNQLNIMVNQLIIIFLFIFSKILFQRNSQKHLKGMLLAVIIIFILFLLLNIFFNNRIFYNRSVFPISILIYFIIADFFQNNLKSLVAKFIVYLLIAIQISQFVLYFFPKLPIAEDYVRFNYRQHPMSNFQNYNFAKDSFLLTIPDWNYTSARYFLSSKVQVIRSSELEKISSVPNRDGEIYVIDQISIDRNRVKNDCDQILRLGYEFVSLKKNENQELLILKKAK